MSGQQFVRSADADKQVMPSFSPIRRNCFPRSHLLKSDTFRQSNREWQEKVIIVMDGMGNGQRMRNGTNDSGPDPDAIKMFVGQVPRTMDEVLCGCFHINLFPPSCPPPLPFSMYLSSRRNFVNSLANSARFTSSTSLGISLQAWAGVKTINRNIIPNFHLSGGVALWPTSTDVMLWRLRTDSIMWRHYQGWVQSPLPLPQAVRHLYGI